MQVQDLVLERGVITVRQQTTLLNYKLTPALTKNRRTRLVQLPLFVADRLREPLTKHESLEGDRTLESSVGGTIFFLRERKPTNKDYFNQGIWLPAIVQAGLPRTRVNGMHGLMHFNASMWLEHGVNIKAVSNYLGLLDPGFSLRIYTHLMDKSDEVTKNSFSDLF